MGGGAAPLHPQINALLAGDQDAAAELGELDLPALRAGYVQVARDLGGEPSPVGAVRDGRAPRLGGAVPLRAYTPARGATEPPIVWFHGGGWVMGDLDGFDHVARELCVRTGRVVVSVDYRLAPEHPFPAGPMDAEAAVRWVAGPGSAWLGTEPGTLVVGGDSSGGHLAAWAALAEPGLVARQLLVYPALDPAMASASYRMFAGGPMLTAGEMARFWAAYLGDEDADAAAIPGARALSAAPPAFVVLAGHDPLRDDGRAYADALRAAGVDAHVTTFEDMTHGFLRWGGVVDRTHELIDALARAVK